MHDMLKKKRAELGISDEVLATILGLGSKGADRVKEWSNGSGNIPKLVQKKIENLPYTLPFKACSNGSSFKFVDLFAGVGGIRLPFQELGGECVFTSEWDKHSQITYATNFGEVPHGDITKIPAEVIPAHNVLLAGFPCQAFSQAGRRAGFLDTRGTMFFEIQRILAHHKPEAFLLENVKQLVGHDNRRTLNTILSILRGEDMPDIPSDVPMSEEARRSLETPLRYDVDFEVLRARDYGVPQVRERVYIVGLKRERWCSPNQNRIRHIFERVKENHRRRVVLADALQDDSEYTRSFEISEKLWIGHVERKKRNLAAGKGFGYTAFDRSAEYCNTISARYYKDGSEILINQDHKPDARPRKLTPEEARNIQGFPPEFNVDMVSNCQNYRQFGNSVAVPVIRAIATELLPELLKEMRRE